MKKPSTQGNLEKRFILKWQRTSNFDILLIFREDEDKRKHPEKYIEKQETPMFTKEGKVRQCDEGGYKPILNQWDDPCFVVFKMNIPK